MSGRPHEAPCRQWLADSPEGAVTEALRRLRRLEDVQQMAVMPDVHLATDVCVGVVLATRRLLYPSAVGGDIGCGLAAVRFDRRARVLGRARSAQRLLDALRDAVPVMRHRSAVADRWLQSTTLSDPVLDAVRHRDGRVQLGTLGRGNHFVEFQRDEDDRLWLMVHTGSRCMGQAVRDLHASRAVGRSHGLPYLDAGSEAGRAYVRDMHWARGYAARNRLHIVRAVAARMGELFDAGADWASLVNVDHNHVRLEVNGGHRLWVHRKGAAPARLGERGLIPGSMGTASYHTRGRGHAASLCSSSHGAGRVLSRSQARKRFRRSHLAQQLSDVWHDERMLHRLTEESPGAYKDIDRVMRAQRELVKVVRRLEPVLVYKGA